ncbi:hypothetical protein roselon_00227 [Roseibacterium elongatum DSM 19469]|uniref:Uncharacterized protein n=1 Tax=Roseicyclus elongatus DSM 19469 TaxID=1294273 RepID=W8RNG1_9RHOB|nr:hypothetical protein [Roseibacterium elongatum]AHM02684.1 hypothetical protein roselon_00227 [Roseibacterium elongatum DSM 19469]
MPFRPVRAALALALCAATPLAAQPADPADPMALAALIADVADNATLNRQMTVTLAGCALRIETLTPAPVWVEVAGGRRVEMLAGRDEMRFDLSLLAPVAGAMRVIEDADVPAFSIAEFPVAEAHLPELRRAADTILDLMEAEYARDLPQDMLNDALRDLFARVQSGAFGPLAARINVLREDVFAHGGGAADVGLSIYIDEALYLSVLPGRAEDLAEAIAAYRAAICPD